MSNVKLVVKNKGPIHSSSAYVFFDDLNGAVVNSITPSLGIVAGFKTYGGMLG